MDDEKTQQLITSLLRGDKVDIGTRPHPQVTENIITLRAPGDVGGSGGVGGGTGSPPPCPGLTYTCAVIQSIVSKQGWFVQDPDPGYGDPVRVFKHAEIQIIRGDEAGGCPRGEFCVRIETFWKADVAVDTPDYCFGGFGANGVSTEGNDGGLVKRPNGVLFQATAAQVTLSDIAGSFVNHNPGDPDVTCSAELVAYHGSGHLGGIDWYPTSTPPANCCCNSSSVDAFYYFNYSLTGSTIEQTKTDDEISYVEYVVGAQKYEFYLTLGDEDTDGAVMSRAIACLPDYPDPEDFTEVDPFCVASRDAWGTGVTIQRMKPKFELASPAVADLEISYFEHFVPDEGTETWTPKTATILEGETFVIGDEVLEPSTDGYIEITDVTC